MTKPASHRLSSSSWMLLMADFGKRLSEVRHRRRLTQAQLAGLLEVAPPLISRWENGISKPQFDSLVKLSEVLEVSLDSLLKGDETSGNGQSFEIRNRRLQELCRKVDQLSREDQDVICHVMDSLVRKEQIKSIVSSSMLRGS